MYDWLIATPAWGGRCLDLFERVTWPAMRLALARVSGRVRFMVHTDDRDRVAAALNGFERHLPRPPSVGNVHQALGRANREALDLARAGEAVAIVNADMVPSVEFFAAAEARFAAGKRLIMVTGTRTLAAEPPPIGAASRELLAWAWRHRHPWIEDCVWGRGRTRTPSIINFDAGTNVVQHAFHLQPAALIKESELGFNGVTADCDLIDAFPRESVHVVTCADEMSFAEVSPPEKQFGRHAEVMSVASVRDWATVPGKTSAMHRWLFTHRICIQGDGQDIGDAAVCAKLLRAIETYRPGRAA